MLVEDHEDVRNALELVLRTEGYDVAVAADGAAALRRLREGFSPAVILLDLNMAGVNGCGFRAEQLRDPQLASIPVVVLSGDGDVRQRAAKLGVAGWLQKPLEIDEMLAVVSRFCPPA